MIIFEEMNFNLDIWATGKMRTADLRTRPADRQ